MSFYRSILAAVAAMALVAPAFADDTTTSTMGADTAMTQTSDSSSATETKVDLNKATAKELMKVKGISSSRAKAIIAFRKKNGDFKSLDEVAKVNGFKNMNEKTLKSIQDHLSVE